MANNVDININAKGAAVAARGLRGVAVQAKRLDRTLDGLSIAAKSAQASFAPLLAVLATYKVASSVAGVISSSSDAFNQQSEAARNATEAQKKFAAELQKTRGIGDEVSLGIMEQARTLGIAEDQMEEVTKAAIGVSEATGEGMNEALKKINRALNGNADAFSEVIPGLTDMKSESEKLAAVNELVNRGLEKQASRVEGLEGFQIKATNAVGDLLEVIGSILEPIRRVISDGIAVFAEAMQVAWVPAVDMAKAAMERLPAVFEFTRKVIVTYAATYRTVLTHLPQMTEWVTTKIQLAWTGMVENTKHVFTVAIPKAVGWFTTNLPTILENGANAATTIAVNFFKRTSELYQLGFRVLLDTSDWFVTALPNKLKELSGKAQDAVFDMFKTLKSMFQKAWQNIKSGIVSGFSGSGTSISDSLKGVMDKAAQTLAEPPKSWEENAAKFAEIMNSNLLEGFKGKELTSLPDLLERQLTDKEKSLKNRAAELGRDIAETFNSNFERIKNSVSAPGLAPGDVEANLKGKGGPGSTALSGGSTAGQLNAVQGRLLTRGPNSELANMNSTLQKQLVKLGLIAKNTDKKQDKKPTPEPIVVRKVGLL